MAKARAALEVEIHRQNGVNRSNCDYLLHALQKVGFQEEDVQPLRKYEHLHIALTLTNKVGKDCTKFTT